MDDVISRQAAINAADRTDYTGLAIEDVKKVTDEVVKEIKRLPSAQRKGKWIWMGDTGDSRWMCSVCKGKEKVPTIMGKPTVWDYCPNCGAWMKGESDDEIH